MKQQNIAHTQAHGITSSEYYLIIFPFVKPLGRDALRPRLKVGVTTSRRWALGMAVILSS